MSTTEKTEQIRIFLKEVVYLLSVDVSAGSIVSLPDFELHPREFLSYAEGELSDLKSNKSIINCLSNLKRAIDSQIDIFLYALNLLKIYKDRKLGIDRKLGFIEKCGIFNKTSLARINTIRNKLEHHYELPKIEDIYVYFDLTSAFISVLEFQLNIGGRFSEECFLIQTLDDDGEIEKIEGLLSSTYNPDEKSHTFSWSYLGTDKKFVANSENLEELATFIRFHTFLMNISNTYHGQYANAQLDKL